MRERETRRIGLHRQRPPNRSPLPAKQGNRRRADRPRLMPVRRRRRRQPTPGDLPRETQAVEPQRVVFAEPGRKHVGFPGTRGQDRKSTRLNSSHGYISYAVFCLKKKNKNTSVTNS